MKSTKKNYKKIVSISLRMIVGAVFVASAILKLISMEVFDLYVFEHNLFPISFTETITRLLIAAELSLGLFLIVGLNLKLVYWTTVAFLIAFTLYLFTLPLFFDVDVSNCHCFGEKVVLSRWQSIIKNVFLLLLLYFSDRTCGLKIRKQGLLSTVLFVIAFGTILIINAPGYLYGRIYGTKVKIDQNLYYQAIKNAENTDNYVEGKKIVCLYSTACPYCKKSAKRLSLIASQNEIDSENFKAVFWRGSADTTIANFFVKQHIPLLDYTTFSVDTFLSITDGQMPVILFVEDGIVLKSVEYQSIDEKELLTFIK